MSYTIPPDNHVVNDPNHTPQHNDIADVLKLYGSTSVINPVLTTYGADPAGSSDSWAAFNSAGLAAAASSTQGGVVLAPSGSYKLSRPWSIPGQVTVCSLAPGNAGAGGTSNDLSGAVFFPANGFANPSSYTQPGVLYMDGTGGTIYRCGVVNCWVDFTIPTTPPAGIHGIASLGAVFHSSIMNSGVRGATGDGIHVQATGTNNANRADGWTLRDCMVQGWSAGGSGFYGCYWYGADTQFVNVHVQQSGSPVDGGGFYVPGAANCTWDTCRSDQGYYGWIFDAVPGLNPATPGTASTLSNCRSENVFYNALWVNNSSTTGQDARNGVACVGCSFDYPAQNGASTGDHAAAVLVAGWNVLTMTDCHIHTGGTSHPAIGLRTKTAGSGPGRPRMVVIDNGFWNVTSGTMIDDAGNVGSTSGCLLRYRFYGADSGSVVAGGSPTHLQLYQSTPWP